MEKVACWRTKAAISLKRVKIDEKLLWTAYMNSPVTNALSNGTIGTKAHKMLGVVVVSVVRESRKFSGHCAVIFAIAQLSCPLSFPSFSWVLSL